MRKKSGLTKKQLDKIVDALCVSTFWIEVGLKITEGIDIGNI